MLVSLIKLTGTDESDKEKGDKAKKPNEHLKLNGIKMLITAVESSRSNKNLLEAFYELLPVITSLMTAIISHMDQFFKDKRVSKSIMALGIFTKLGTTLAK